MVIHKYNNKRNKIPWFVGWEEQYNNNELFEYFYHPKECLVDIWTSEISQHSLLHARVRENSATLLSPELVT